MTDVLAGFGLRLADTAGTAIPGDLTIENNASVTLLNGTSLAATTTVTLNGQGTLALGPQTSSITAIIAGLQGTSGTSSVIVDGNSESSDTDNVLTLSGTGSYAYAGQITDEPAGPNGNAFLGLTKQGSGTQILSGVSTYNDATIISAAS